MVSTVHHSASLAVFILLVGAFSTWSIAMDENMITSMVRRSTDIIVPLNLLLNMYLTIISVDLNALNTLISLISLRSRPYLKMPMVGMLAIKSIHPQRINLSLLGAFLKSRMKSIRNNKQTKLSIMPSSIFVCFGIWQNVVMVSDTST